MVEGLKDRYGRRKVAEIGLRHRQVEASDALHAVVAECASKGQCLLEQSDGPTRFAQFSVGNAKVTEGPALASPVLDLASNGQALLVIPDRPAPIAQIGIAVAEVTEGHALAGPVPDVAGDRHGGIEPGDVHSGMHAHREDVRTRERVVEDETGDILGTGHGFGRPRLPGQDVRPLAVGEGESCHEGVIALQEQVVRGLEHNFVVLGVPSGGDVALGLGEARDREETGEIMQTVTTRQIGLDQAVAGEVAQQVGGVVGSPLGDVRRPTHLGHQTPDGGGCEGIERAAEDRQGAPAGLQVRSQKAVADPEGRFDAGLVGVEPEGRIEALDAAGLVAEAADVAGGGVGEAALEEAAGQAEGERQAPAERGDRGGFVGREAGATRRRKPTTSSSASASRSTGSPAPGIAKRWREVTICAQSPGGRSGRTWEKSRASSSSSGPARPSRVAR